MTETDQHVDPELEIAADAALSTALVIGIGGSGIHTLSRLRPAIRDRSRPAAVAHDNIVFLGMDSVDQASQYPALPPEAGLSDKEFFNVVPRPLNALHVWKQRWSTDAYLRQWGDVTYTPPNEQLVNGLKRSRMLGRLAFQEITQTMEAKIASRIRECVQLGGEKIGVGGIGGELRTYIVASAVGGTGSAGFLPVLRAAHAAAAANGITLKVWPVIYPASVLRAVWAEHPELRVPHEANTYAFFRELDHFASVEGAFDDYMTPPGRQPLGLEPGALIEGAMVVDSTLSNGTSISQADTYELVASNLYDVLLAGQRKLSTVLDTNVSVVRSQRDAKRMRTCYLSIGAARAVFPGTTYRRYLHARTRAHVVNRMIGGDVNEVQRDRESKLTDHLYEGMTDLLDELNTIAESDEQASRALNLSHSMREEIESVERDDRFGQAEDFISRLRGMSTSLPRSLDSSLQAESRLLKRKVDEVVDKKLADSGEPLSVMVYAMDKLRGEERLVALLNHDESKMRVASNGTTLNVVQNDDESIAGSLRKYKIELESNLLARATSWGKDEERALDHLIVQVDETARWVREEPIYSARRTLIEYMLQRVDEAHGSLIASRTALREIQSGLNADWWNDEYAGKDRGPTGLTWYLPDDTAPGNEVDKSVIAESLWHAVTSELESDPKWDLRAGGSDQLRNIFRDWNRSQSGARVTRGVVGLGSGEESDLAAASRTRLDEVLTQLTESIARPKERMPKDIFDAVEQVDDAGHGQRQQEMLNAALANLSRISNSVAIKLDPARILDQQGGTTPPAVNSQISTSQTILDKLPQFSDSTPIDTSDGETIDLSTYQMGFPFHAIENARSWKHSYEQVQTVRRNYGATAKYPPAHIDDRFESELRLLMPRMFFDEDMARIVAMVSLISQLSKHDPAGYEDLRLGGMFPLRSEDRQEGRRNRMVFVGTKLSYGRNGARYSGDVELGANYRELFDSLSIENLLRDGLDDLIAAVMLRLKNQDLRHGLTVAAETYADHLRQVTIPRISQNRGIEVAERDEEMRLAGLIVDQIHEFLQDMREWSDPTDGPWL